MLFLIDFYKIILEEIFIRFFFRRDFIRFFFDKRFYKMLNATSKHNIKIEPVAQDLVDWADK